MNKKSSIVVLMLVFVIVLNVCSYGKEQKEDCKLPSEVQNFIEQMITVDSEYSMLVNATIKEIPIFNLDATERFILYSFDCADGKKAYIIWNNTLGTIAETAINDNPYSEYLDNENLSKYELVYDSGNYGIETKNQIVWIDEMGNEYIVENKSSVSTYSVISGVNPQLQNSSNCIVAAVSNLLYFWSGHGYSTLNYKSSFDAIKSDINYLFNGCYANNDVPEVVSSYCRSRGLSATSKVVWNPEFNVLTDDIIKGKPCLVGFAAGSPYSSSVGHMTMCFGYHYVGGSYLLYLADGHSSSVVYKAWSTTYNDCVISVTIY